MSAHVLGPPVGGITGLLTAVNPQPAAALVTPLLWFDATNIDGTNNSSLIDGQALGTCLNLGTLGSTNNVVQATAGNKPAFNLVASAGKLNNKSGIAFADTSRNMLSAAFTLIPQPWLLAIVFSSDNSAATGVLVDARSPVSNVVKTGAGAIHVNAGSDVATPFSPAANSFNMMLVLANGASSEARVNGVSSGNISAGTNSYGTAISLGFSGTFGFVGKLMEVRLYGATPPAASLVEAALVTKWGSFPQ